MNTYTMEAFMPLELTEKIKKILFEDNWNKYGSEYMSHPIDQQPAVTISAELPVVPSPTASMQLTDSAPPVDDDTYIPKNSKELAIALATLAEKVPADHVENIYRQVKTVIFHAEHYVAKTAEETEEAAEIDTELEEEEDGLLEVRTLNLFNHIIESGLSDWSGIKFGRQYKLEDAPVAQPHEIPPEELKGKYIAQYYRDRPGKDPSKHKGSGESTMVTASGRLMQSVVKPLMGVSGNQLEDAVEYLRLQFKVITEDEPDIPKEADRAFSGMYLKKLVPKMGEGELKNFLTTVVSDFKKRPKKWLQDFAAKATAEAHSERQAFAKLVQTLDKEDSEQAEVLHDLFPEA
jgi:hypothetical protein